MAVEAKSKIKGSQFTAADIAIVGDRQPYKGKPAGYSQHCQAPVDRQPPEAEFARRGRDDFVLGFGAPWDTHATRTADVDRRHYAPTRVPGIDGRPGPRCLRHQTTPTRASHEQSHPHPRVRSFRAPET